ncbi:hypothetical protein [uncultured Gimesia sp.]|uniref:hypothetical protein n=1 Tax=uncultured Gimesia sp. TaxID=1678688 RepID=UPI0030D7354C
MATIAEITRCHQKFSAAQHDEKLLSQFVDSALQHCQLALAELEGRLTTIGYPVQSLIIDSDGDQDQRISRIEALTDRRVPAILNRLWHLIGGISFVDLEDYSHFDFWEGQGIKGAKGVCDGVYVESCSQEWLAYTIDDFEACKADHAESEFVYTFAPDGYHKDDISGGPPYGLQGDNWLPAVVDFRWTGFKTPESAKSLSLDFLGYLRTSILECGGFPGLLGHPKFEPIREKLVAGLPLF